MKFCFAALSGRGLSENVVKKCVLPALLILLFISLLLGYWLAVPLIGLTALGAVGLSLLISAKLKDTQPGAISRAMPALALAATLVLPASFYFEPHQARVPDLGYAWITWLVAAAFFITSLHIDHSGPGKAWKVLGMVWAFAGAIVWLVACYLQNDRVGFYFAAGVVIALTFLCKALFRFPYVAVLVLNTLLLVLVLLPVFDMLVRPRYVFDLQRDDPKKLYSYEGARRDPEAFAAWWLVYYEQFHKLVDELGRSGPTQHLSVLPPGAKGSFFQSQIQINNKGFRGRDIPDEKGNTYRIVALGESTTFGATMHQGDKPWPDVLEEIIRERLRPTRPVQVINAGIFAFTITRNLDRLPTEILPLKPDMIISYHGINGFNLLDPSIPALTGPRAPAFRPRPLVLLARAEYGIKMRLYRQRLTKGIPTTGAQRSPPLKTPYAQAYRELIHACATNHIRLALANFSMAVNNRSDPDLIAFYQAGFPSVYRQMQANTLHSGLIEALAKEFPDVSAINTHPQLDAVHEKFIDLIHLTQEGRVQLAENVFADIKDALARDLGQ